MASFRKIHWLALLGACFAGPAAALVTCCDVDGHRTCGDPPPRACEIRLRTVYDKSGTMRTIEAPMTAEQRAAREAEELRKKEEDRKAAEQARRDRALTGSFSTAADIDLARDRAVADIEKNAEQSKARLDAALKKQQQLDQEKEFYQKKPMPAPLVKQLEDNAKEIAAYRKAVEQTQADIAATRERFDADKARFLLITGQAARK